MICATILCFWLQGHSYGPAQRDAVLWNATRESGLNPAAVSPDGRHSGLFQWNGARKAALFAYARAHGKHWSDALVQLEYMNSELRSMAFARRFFAATSATAARALFCREFEKAARC